MPFYEITTKGEEAKRLVKAESAAAAIRYCARDKFQARTISSVDEAAGLFTAGVKVEDAGAEPPAQKAEPVQEPGGGEGGETGKGGKAGAGAPPPAKDD